MPPNPPLSPSLSHAIKFRGATPPLSPSNLTHSHPHHTVSLHPLFLPHIPQPPSYPLCHVILSYQPNLSPILPAYPQPISTLSVIFLLLPFFFSSIHFRFFSSHSKSYKSLLFLQHQHLKRQDSSPLSFFHRLHPFTTTSAVQPYPSPHLPNLY